MPKPTSVTLPAPIVTALVDYLEDRAEASTNSDVKRAGEACANVLRKALYEAQTNGGSYKEVETR